MGIAGCIANVLQKCGGSGNPIAGADVLVGNQASVLQDGGSGQTFRKSWEIRDLDRAHPQPWAPGDYVLAVTETGYGNGPHSDPAVAAAMAASDPFPTVNSQFTNDGKVCWAIYKGGDPTALTSWEYRPYHTGDTKPGAP